MHSFKTVALCANPTKLGIESLLLQVKSVFEKHGLQVIVAAEWHERLALPGAARQDWLECCDLVVCLGGDGTILQVSREVAEMGKPLASINAGRLGFLTTAKSSQIGKLAQALVKGEYIIEKRKLLKALYQHANAHTEQFFALNEVAIVRGKTARMVEVDAWIEGKLLNQYHADGLLVATATGSTAYSLSAGGPLIDPQAEVFCITPVCPHGLHNRSLVIPDTKNMQLIPRARTSHSSEMLFSVDGRDLIAIEDGDRIHVSSSELSLELIRFEDHSFAEVLRSKLRWISSEV